MLLLFKLEYPENINHVPRKTKLGKHRSVFHLRKNTNKDEMWLYFGVCLIMGVIQKSEYYMYWTRQHTFATRSLSLLMGRDQFEHFRKMVHFSNPENEDLMYSLRKFRFFSLHVIKKIILQENIRRLMIDECIYHSGRVD